MWQYQQFIITARREHERGDFTRIVHKGIWDIACDSQGCSLRFINIIENRSLRVCLRAGSGGDLSKFI